MEFQHGDVTKENLAKYVRGLTAGNPDGRASATAMLHPKPVRRRTGKGLASKNERKARIANAKPARYPVLVNYDLIAGAHHESSTDYSHFITNGSMSTFKGFYDRASGHDQTVWRASPQYLEDLKNGVGLEKVIVAGRADVKSVELLDWDIFDEVGDWPIGPGDKK